MLLHIYLPSKTERLETLYGDVGPTDYVLARKFASPFQSSSKHDNGSMHALAHRMSGVSVAHQSVNMYNSRPPVGTKLIRSAYISN